MVLRSNISILLNILKDKNLLILLKYVNHIHVISKHLRCLFNFEITCMTYSCNILVARDFLPKQRGQTNRAQGHFSKPPIDRPWTPGHAGNSIHKFYRLTFLLSLTGQQLSFTW